MLSWVNETLAIGELSDIFDEDLLKKEKVTHVINLTSRNNELVDQHFRKEEMQAIEYCYSPISTDPNEDLNWFRIECHTAYVCLAVRLTTNPRPRIIVSCDTGNIMSSFVTALYLHKEDKMSFINAYSLIKSKRPSVSEHLEWIDPEW